MAKDGYKRPIRKWVAQTFDKGPIILLQGAIIGAISGVGIATLDDNNHWDASSVPAENEAIFTQAIDQKFSAISDLQSAKQDLFIAQETAKFNDDMDALKDLATKTSLIDQDITSKSTYLADKLLSTYGISEQKAAQYAKNFNQAGLSQTSKTDLSDVNMQFRNECSEESDFTACVVKNSKAADEQETDQLVALGMAGGGLFFFSCLIAGITRENRGWGNRWNDMNDIPTLKTKISGALKQKKPPKLSN